MRHLRALGMAALLSAACNVDSSAPTEDIQSHEGALVNGHVATEAEYPATVLLIHDNLLCTATKVGPRHFLIAAHCMPNPQNTTQISVTPDNTGANFINLTVASVNNHPQYTNCTSCAGDNSMSDFGLRPDVSLIIVQELSPSIPEAVIDSSPVAVGSSVTLTGFGCENVQPAPPLRFKVGDAQSISPLELDPAATIPQGYVTSYGPAIVPGNPALCPGDSGGPLYRTGTNLVVGVNALVSGTDAGEVGNWFTRLDNQSRYNVYGWLNGLLQAPTTPCGGLCANPTSITTQWFGSGSLGTGARCFESTFNLTSAACGGFAGGRTFSVNGVNATCNGANLTLPPKRNGGYCFQASAGQQSWAWFQTW